MPNCDVLIVKPEEGYAIVHRIAGNNPSVGHWITGEFRWPGPQLLMNRSITPTAEQPIDADIEAVVPSWHAAIRTFGSYCPPRPPLGD